jgi:acyl carrier protein
METPSIKATLLDYVFSKSDVESKDLIPLDKSLLYEGILDSFAVIELVEYIESTWDISIDDSEFTVEKMGSIDKMEALINEKLHKKTSG